MGERPGSIADRLLTALSRGPATSGELGRLVGLSASEACAHLCRQRRHGRIDVVGKRPSQKGRDENIWALLSEENTDMSGSNPIKIRPEYTDRPCLGPLCRGKKMFRSAGPQNRMCNHCKELVKVGDAQHVAQEVEGWAR